MTTPRSRRAVLLAFPVALLAACAGPPSAPPAPAGDTVTVEHALGTTVVTGAPQRVVALGPTDLDAALAVGATPVGAASTGIGEGGLPEWTRAALGAHTPTVLEVAGDAQQVDLEAVAALRPDLILASGYMTVPAALGLGLSPAVLAIPQGDSFAVTVSRENLASLEADVLALYFGGDATAQAELMADPLFTRLDVVRRGAVVVLDDQEFYALRQPTALSIPYLLDRVAPRIAEAARR